MEQAGAEQLQLRQSRLKAEQEETARRLEQQKLQSELAEREKEAQAKHTKEVLKSQLSLHKQTIHLQSQAEQVVHNVRARRDCTAFAFANIVRNLTQAKGHAFVMLTSYVAQVDLGAEARQKPGMPVTCRQMRPQPKSKQLPHAHAQARTALTPILPRPEDSWILPAPGLPQLAADDENTSSSVWQDSSQARRPRQMTGRLPNLHGLMWSLEEHGRS